MTVLVEPPGPPKLLSPHREPKVKKIRLVDTAQKAVRDIDAKTAEGVGALIRSMSVKKA